MADRVADPTWIRRTSRQEGFNQDYFERAYRLAHLLGEIGRHPRLTEKVALKGGTCINFFYADLHRLSVDLDLNYVGSVSKDGMESDREELLGDLEDLVESLGYRFEKVTSSYAVWKGRFVYENAHGSADSIKADINFLMRVPLYGIHRHTLPDLFDLDGETPCLALEDVYGGKFKTVATRGHPRDLYDAAGFLDDPPDHHPEQLRKATLFYLYMDDAGLGTADLDRARNITLRDCQESLYPTLREDDRPTPDELTGPVLPHMEDLLELTEEERAFGERLADRAYEPRRLFGDVDVADDIARHPAAEWRRRNPHAKMDDDTGKRWRPRTCPDCGKSFKPMTDAMWRTALRNHLGASARHMDEYSVEEAAERVDEVTDASER